METSSARPSWPVRVVVALDHGRDPLAQLPGAGEGLGGLPFAFFAGMMVAQFFAMLFVYPETKGITLEQLQRKLGIA